MKGFLFTIISTILFIGCQNDIKNIDSTDASDTLEFISQSQLHEQAFSHLNFSNETQWDSLNGIHAEPIQFKKGHVDSNFRTFGWHIYSNGTAYKNYNFAMLWGLSYFAYSVKPETGEYLNIHQWKTTALIDSAKANNCKVFLTVSNFGSENNSTFLNNPKAQQTLIDSLAILLAFRDADGINIDFEGVSKESKEAFTKFLVLLSKKLKQVNPKYMVSLCLYAVDWNDVFDIKAIDPYIDFYTLMGYDYYGSFSPIAGPVTPFNSSKDFGKGLEASVNYYINKGVPSKSLIVGLPYYGAEWHTANIEIPSKVRKFKSHPSYRDIRKLYIDSLKTPLQFDTSSASSYIILKDSSNAFRQLWFEDVKSLSIKYDWIKNNKMGGVGIWALGYDHGYTELWDLLTDKFSIEQNKDSINKNIKSINNEKSN